MIYQNFSLLRLVFKSIPQYIISRIVLSLSSVVVSVSSTLFLKFAMDTLTGIMSLNSFIICAVSISVFYIIYYILNSSFKHILEPKAILKFKKETKLELYNKARVISLSNYDDPDFLDKYVMVMENFDQKALQIVDTNIIFLQSFLSILGFSALVIKMNSPILIATIILSIANFAISMIMSKLSYKKYTTDIINNRKQSYVNRVYYLKDYAKDIRTSSISTSLNTFFENAINSSIRVVKAFQKKSTVFAIIPEMLQAVYHAFLIIYLVLRTIGGAIGVGDFTLVYNSAFQLSYNIEQLLQIIPEFYKNSLFISDFHKFNALSVAEAKNEDMPKLGNFSELTFKNVSFQYNNTELFILKDISFKISSGEKIAFVGLNGAGKSTIAKLALGLYSPTLGDCLLNGEPHSHYSKKSIYATCNAIFQDFQIFSLSIGENVLMRPIDTSHSKKDEDMIWKSLELVGLKEKVSKLPLGIHTHLTKEIEKDGANFSGGELQKLALARCLVDNYQLIILDEPTSALDPKSEAHFFDELLRVHKDKAMILISHRLSNLRIVDTIYYLVDGKIVEKGSHQELMTYKSHYSKLYQLQCERYM